jgi:hypothetical protein
MDLFELKTGGNRKVRWMTGVSLMLAAVFGAAQLRPSPEAAEPQATLHAVHVQDQELGCSDCHARDSGVQRQVCENCHDAAEVNGLLQEFADRVRSARGAQPTTALVFDHASHPAKVTCGLCHQHAETIERISFYENLRMSACMECHEEEGGPLQCTLCHGSGAISPPPNHAQDFRRRHGVAAGLDDRHCGMCHEQRYCQDCHEGVNLQGSIHPLNFRQTHAFEALGKEEDCLVCHESRSFCVDCHRTNLVLRHPLGQSWANTSDGGNHRDEAETDLESCLSCHDLGADDPVCLRPGCHK